MAIKIIYLKLFSRVYICFVEMKLFYSLDVIWTNKNRCGKTGTFYCFLKFHVKVASIGLLSIRFGLYDMVMVLPLPCPLFICPCGTNIWQKRFFLQKLASFNKKKLLLTVSFSSFYLSPIQRILFQWYSNEIFYMHAFSTIRYNDALLSKCFASFLCRYPYLLAFPNPYTNSYK
jgi:hypothetical protein